MLIPAPGRSVVKMKPIPRYVDTGLVAADGIRIAKPESAIEMEEAQNNRAMVVKIGPPREGEEIWFNEGEEILISRLGGVRFEVRTEDVVQPYWLLPNECVLGVFRDDAQ